MLIDSKKEVKRVYPRQCAVSVMLLSFDVSVVDNLAGLNYPLTNECLIDSNKGNNSGEFCIWQGCPLIRAAIRIVAANKGDSDGKEDAVDQSLHWRSDE
jgi:hypothetical protein